MLSTRKICLVFIAIYHCYLKKRKLKNVISLFATFIIKKKALKRTLNHGLILKKVQRVIQFNQKAWLKPYIYMNTKAKK